MRSEDAHLLRVRLTGLDIPSVVCDDATASVMPHMTNAIGGAKVWHGIIDEIGKLDRNGDR